MDNEQKVQQDGTVNNSGDKQADSPPPMNTIQLDAATNTAGQPQPTGEPTTPFDDTEQLTRDYGIFKRHMLYDPLAILFAILVFIGGCIGYATKQSTASLVAGTIFAFLLAGATWFEGARKNSYPLIAVLLALAALMTNRAYVNGRFLPAGVVATLAFIMLARHCYLLYLRRSQAAS